MLIVFCSFVVDFDVFFSKYAKNHNHRMLITHSIIPSIILFVLGIIFWHILIFCSIAYFIHVFVDTFDWGTNFFYFQQKVFGLKFLISKEEFENIYDYLSKYKNPASFFDFKYYNNKICLIIEALLFVLMIVFTGIFAIEFIFIVLLYFFFLGFHLSRHFHLKNVESQ